MAGGNKCCFAGIAPSRNPIGHHVLTADMSVVSAILGKSGSSHWAPWDGTVPHLHAGEFLWIDVIDAEGAEIEALQRAFGLHDLAVEDSMGTAHTAKVDLYADHIYVVAKAAELGPTAIQYTDISIFLTDRHVITLCRTESSFGHRLRDTVQRITPRKTGGPEYVVHQVLDLIVDHYFPVVQMITDEILLIEKRVLTYSLRTSEVERIFQLRREAIHFQHVITRMMEVCNKLATLDVPCVSSEAKPYFRDVLGTLIRMENMGMGLIDVIRTALEASSLLEQQRQSAITRQLAAWAAILGVPTAIAGIYGMNFINMPETQTSWGYFAILAVMFSICGGLHWRFRKLGWLQSAKRRDAINRSPRGSFTGHDDP